MKNLKKVLALVLAFACAFTMFAGAASYSDQADIKNADAVDMLSALGVIKGYTDGSFKPDATITRAEMAKMIYTIRNGGNDNADQYKSLSTSFTDVNGTWGAGYIKYCQLNGIIAGESATRFNPDGKVTVAQTAKMALVLMGYKPEANRANLVGSGWANRTLALATDNGLLDGVKGGVNEPITRDEAALLLYNTVDTKCVLWSNDKEAFIDDTFTVGTGKDSYVNTYTVGTKYLGLQEWIGSFEGNYDVSGVGNNNQVTVKGSIDGQHKNSSWAGAAGGANASFKYDFSNDYVGEEVSVLFKDGKNGTDNQPDDKDTIYGIYVTGNTSVVNSIRDKIDDDYNTTGKVSINDKAYKVAAAGKIVTNFVNSATGTPWATKAAGVTAIEALNATNGDKVRFILDDNSEIVAVYVTEYKITKVTAVNSTKVSLQGVGSIDLEDNDVYDGIAKNDVVVYEKLYNATHADATYVVTKAESVSGKLKGFKGTEKVTIDSTTYSTMNKTLASGLTNNAKTSFVANDIDKSITAYMVNGFVGAVDMSESAKNYALVESVGNGDIGGVDEFKIKVMLADGSEKTVTIDEDGTVNTKGAFGPGDLIKYSSISNDNEMTVSAVAKDYSGGDLLTASATGDGKNVYDKDTKSFAQDADVRTWAVSTSEAVLFVKVGTKNYAYTMRSLGNIKAVQTTTKFYSALDNDGKVEAAYAELDSKPSGSTSNTAYGIVTADNGTVYVGDEYKKEYKVANDKEEYTVYTSTSSTKLAKGDIVSFDVASDSIYADSDLTVYTTGSYIKELDKDNVLSYFTGKTGSTGNYTGTGVTTKALDDDAQIVYVNQDKDKAGEDVGVNEFDKINGYANAVIVLDSNGTKVSAIIIESSTACDVVNAPAVPSPATIANGTIAFSAGAPTAPANGTLKSAMVTAAPTLTPYTGIANVSAVTWDESANTGTAGTADTGETWTATVTLTANTGYVFGAASDYTVTSATVSGGSGNTLTVTYSFTI